jgi:co-chaperonin GroES (HSP10)
MVEVTLHRVLLKPDELKREHKVEGTDVVLAIAAPAGLEARQEASIQQGYITVIGPTAFKHEDVPKDTQPQVGDFVLWAKYAGVGVIDPETNEKLVILNDDDVLCILKRGAK